MSDENASSGIRITSAEVVGGFRSLDRAAFHPHDDGTTLRQCNRKYFPPDQDQLLAAERVRRDVSTRIDFLLESGQRNAARQFLTSFTFLAARLVFGGAGGLLADFRRAWSHVPMTDWPNVRLIHDALALAEPILTIAPSQLPEQLLARLPFGRDERIDTLLRLAQRFKQEGAWLRPLTASFTGPGEGLRRVLERHRGLPSAVAFSSDGSLLASADAHEVLLWDLRSYEICATLTGHDEEVTDLLFTADGRFMIAAVRAPDLFCWELATRGCAQRLFGHTGAVLTLLAVPDGRTLSADTDGALLAWNLPHRQPAPLAKLSDSIHSLVMFPDGEHCLIASGKELSGPSILTVWHLGRQQIAREIVWEHGEINRATVTGDGRFVLAASNQLLLRWSLPGWEGPDEIGRHGWRISQLASNHDGRWVVSADTGGGVQVWNPAEPASPRILKGHRLTVSGISLSAKGQLATTGYDKTVRIWEMPPPDASPAQTAHRKAISRVAAWSRDGRSFVISTSQDHDLAIIDLDSVTEKFRLLKHAHWVSGVAVAANQNLAVSVSWDGTIALWQLGTGKLLRQITTSDVHLQAVVVDHEGKRIITAPYEGMLRLWDLGTAEEIAAVDAGVGQISCLALSLDGRRLVAGGRGLACMEVTADRLLPRGRVSHSGEQIQATALYPDAVRCLAATASGKIHLCHLDACRTISTWQDSPSGISDVALSPCGRWAGTASGLPHSSSDDTLRVWNCETGQAVARFVGDAPFSCCCFSAVGQRIVAGDTFGRLHVFAVEGIP